MKELHIHQNTGAALLLFVLVTTIIASTLLLKALNLRNTNQDQNTDIQVMLLAKEALIGYAISYADRNTNSLPGYLPCPDFDGDGLADSPCGNINQSSFGRLPWQTLGLPPLRDSAGECLWYALTGAYKENPAGSISHDAGGQLLLFDANLNSLNGANNRETAIAIIFSGGSPINPQNRSLRTANATECASTRAADRVRNSRQYFEILRDINNATGRNTAGNIAGLTVSAIPTSNFSVFIDPSQSAVTVPPTINDKMTKISPNDFSQAYRLMQQTIGDRVRQCLNAYALANSGKLPWPAVLSGPGNPSYIDNPSQLRFGRIASNLVNSQTDGLNSVWPMDPQQPTVRCFNWSWWPAIRESVFIAIDESVSATGVTTTPVLTVDGVNNSSAIIIAGRPGANQNRTDGNDKATISNYLETANVIDLNTGLIPPGDENFVTSDANALFFNDYVCTLTLCP